MGCSLMIQHCHDPGKQLGNARADVLAAMPDTFDLLPVMKLDLQPAL